MKPLGMTPMFEVIRPTPAEDAIWAAVEAALDAGMTSAQFKAECRAAWSHYLNERRKADDAEWSRS